MTINRLQQYQHNYKRHNMRIITTLLMSASLIASFALNATRFPWPCIAAQRDEPLLKHATITGDGPVEGFHATKEGCTYSMHVWHFCSYKEYGCWHRWHCPQNGVSRIKNCSKTKAKVCFENLKNLYDQQKTGNANA
jgi:hypothetical protein